MSDISRINKSNPGILGYDPKKARPTPMQLKCPYCWFAHHAKNQMTKHINENHWDEAKK
jgi:hypothetical protein